MGQMLFLINADVNGCQMVLRRKASNWAEISAFALHLWASVGDTGNSRYDNFGAVTHLFPPLGCLPLRRSMTGTELRRVRRSYPWEPSVVKNSWRMNWSAIGALCLFLVATHSHPLQAQYSPDHPKVRAMVDKGLAFLNSGEGANGGYGVGQALLVGYTFLKATGDVDHPKVKQGLEMALSVCNSLPNYRAQGESKIIYESAVAAVLLASIDPVKYQPQLNGILYFYQSHQKPHGGFGYLERPTGDTSQVQYVMLALWTMHEADIDVPPALVESTLKYLRATMDPRGGWGYQGKVGNGQLIGQEGVTKSLATAGIGAVIIGGDILGLFGARKKDKDKDDGIPDAFKRIDLLAKARLERREITMTMQDIQGPLNLGTRFQNATKFDGSFWYYYWRYSQERYESFVEIVNGQQNKSPDWYNDGVNELASLQSAEGSWGQLPAKTVTTEQIDTSLAILFLIRSTQKAIGKIDSGLASGGIGLPTDLTKIKMRGDKIVSDSETSVENLLTMLEGDASDVQAGLLPDNMALTKDPVQRKEQVARLARLLSSKDYLARRIAAKLLGRSEDMEQVPELIYALTDDDPYVPMIAEESLRLLSRRLSSGKLGVEPSPAERAAAVKFWKSWYLGLRPDYIFIDR